MEVHRIVLIVCDHDNMGVDAVCDAIANARYPNRCISPHIISGETREIGTWSDDNPLNFTSKVEAEACRLFDIKNNP